MSQCQLCGADAAENTSLQPSGEAALCVVCAAGVAGEAVDGPHWQCLHEALHKVRHFSINRFIFFTHCSCS